jgi:REP element-mobilizing transposase RayT
MAFRLRLQFPGAIYHVINRGNYRSWIFAHPKTKAAFESCLFDACARNRWLLHAFVVMSNHYHLALETPLGNLAAGMQWLQSTFANRFNRFRDERGHLFQSRYKALLVEPGDALGHVCHYINLNPVRADLIAVARLAEYRYSSYAYLARPGARPSCLRVMAPLDAAGGIPDTPLGWRCYADYLTWQAAEGPAGKNEAYVCLSRGWVIGSDDFKREILADPAIAAEAQRWEEHGPEEAKNLRWEDALIAALRRVPPAAKAVSHKSAPWKRAVALHLHETTDASNQWLAEMLDMGSAVYVSKHLGLTRRDRHAIEPLLRALEGKR